MDKENSKGGEQPKKQNIIRWDAVEPIGLFDRTEKIYVRIKMNPTKKTWERWVSKTKKTWEMTHDSLSLAEVIKFQEDVVSSNYKNFYKFIFRK